MNSGADRRDERLARAVIERVTRPKLPAPIIGVLRRGRWTAYSITKMAGPVLWRSAPWGSRPSFDLEARIKRLNGRLPMPGRWKWVVDVAHPKEPPRVQGIYPKAVRAREAHEVTDIEDLPATTLVAILISSR